MRLLWLMAAMPLAVQPFPFMANHPNIDPSVLKAHSAHVKRQGCPVNPNHPGAAPLTAQYPYLSATNGLPGNGNGGIQVPASGDTAHAYVAPGPNDIRGPCPGMNVLANHNFLSHDGLTTFNEVVDAQQNAFNVAYDLAVTLATIGVGLDGDPVTGKVSIGCGGLNTHNKFESDMSLTRQDYDTNNGDDYTFQQSLFDLMATTTNNNFNTAGIANYKFLRFNQSVANNPNFYFGPKGLALYGAAAFLYQLFPNLGPAGTPDLATIGSFFGSGTTPGHEKFPANWKNRVSPHTNMEFGNDMLNVYSPHPVLLGGNVGKNNYNAMGSFGPLITNGKVSLNPQDAKCFLYQLATENVPNSLTGVETLSAAVLAFSVGKLNPVFVGSGCTLKTV